MGRLLVLLPTFVIGAVAGWGGAASGLHLL
jgi:hypothetical protein